MNRLRAYREIENKSGAETAKLLGISTSMVSAIESGRRPLTISLDPLGYSSDRFELPDMSEPHHRQLSRTRVSSTRRAKELLRLGGELYNELIAAVGARASMLERLGPITDHAQLAQIADLVRGALGAEPTGPIRNLTAAVERAGVCLVPISDLDGIDGISAWVDGRPVVGLAPDVPGDRFRLTLAHELGHLVMHSRAGENSEHEANRFASLLLLPPDDFEAAVPPRPTIRDFVHLKASWGVSVAALIYRSHEEGILDDRRYRSLQIQMSKWRHVEPGRFEALPGRALPDLLERAGGPAAVAERHGLNEDHVRLTTTWAPPRASLRLVR
ncbi:MAG: ImmA/IrrE family metallo-endopeptidase [Actinomycetota bacterium]